MKTIMPLLFITSLLVRPARADVYIYRGTAKISADLASAAPFDSNINIYLVIDYDGGQFGSLVFMRNQRRKALLERLNQHQPIRHCVRTANGRTESYFGSSTAINNSATDFNFTTTLSFAVRIKFAHPQDALRHTGESTEAVLKGVGIALSSNSTFGDERFGLTFLGTATIKANNANQTIDQALDDLVTALGQRGFTSL